MFERLARNNICDESFVSIESVKWMDGNVFFFAKYNSFIKYFIKSLAMLCK